MIETAFILATLTTAGFLIIYLKLPKPVRLFIQKHALATDCIALFVIYLLLGRTLTALMAGAMSGLFVSILLYFAGNKQHFVIKAKDIQSKL